VVWKRTVRRIFESVYLEHVGHLKNILRGGGFRASVEPVWKGWFEPPANRQWIRRWQAGGRGRRTKGWRSTELHWARWIGGRLSFLTPREGSTAALIFTDWCRKNYPISWHPSHRTLVPFPCQGAATHHRFSLLARPDRLFNPLIPRSSSKRLEQTQRSVIRSH